MGGVLPRFLIDRPMIKQPMGELRRCVILTRVILSYSQHRYTRDLSSRDFYIF